jgi:hypothetical protein
VFAPTLDETVPDERFKSFFPKYHHDDGLWEVQNANCYLQSRNWHGFCSDPIVQELAENRPEPQQNLFHCHYVHQEEHLVWQQSDGKHTKMNRIPWKMLLLNVQRE